MAMRSGDKSMNAGPGDFRWKPFAQTIFERSRPARFFPDTAVLPIFLLLLLLGLAFPVRHGAPATDSTDSPLKAASEVSVAGEKGFLRNGTAAGPKTLRLTGTTVAMQSRAILAPLLSGQQLPTLTITRILPAGSRVKRGDLLVEFDRQAQLRDFLDKQAEYDKLVGQVAEQQMKEGVARAKDETELHQAESDLKNAQLEMKKIELLARIDADKAQQNLEQAQATFQQLKETFDLKRTAARAAIRILEIQRDRTQRIMDNAKNNAALMQMHAPLDGVIVLNTIWKNGKMGEAQEGDQIQPGVPFMQVVNPSAMQVQVSVNQQDVLGLRIGQPAQVRLDAYPQLVLAGKLEQIAPIGLRGSFSAKVRSFLAIFSIEGSDSKLMPDLSAQVDVEPQAPLSGEGGSQ